MAYRFAPAHKAPYEEDGLYFGLDPDSVQRMGVATERHAITIAGSGSGKGVCLIIPNLLRWPHAALVIDPKGENAEKTWQAREEMGQKVAVLDPFHEAKVPDRLRLRVNLLAGINTSKRSAKGDIMAIADGLVKRHNAAHGEWDDGCVLLFAGIIAYILQNAPPAFRTLDGIRQILLQPENKAQGDNLPENGLWKDAHAMLRFEGCGKLSKNAGLYLIEAMTQEKGIEKDVLNKAKRISAWLDEDAFQEVLGPDETGKESFSLSELKTGKATLYLVLPPARITDYGEFLRVFVRTALDVMAQGGNNSGGKCLFILDEFYSLGRIDLIAKAAGLMRSYGVQLWPFMQDIGQLFELYGHDAGHTFFSNADAHLFMGNTDAPTLGYIANRLGAISPEDVGGPPRMKTNFFGLGHEVSPSQGIANENARLTYQHNMARVGKPRMTENEVRELVKKLGPNKPARYMIAITHGDEVHCVELWPYFRGEPLPPGGESFSPSRLGSVIRLLRKTFIRDAALLGIPPFVTWLAFQNALYAAFAFFAMCILYRGYRNLCKG